MRVLITGCSGFIGQHLVALLHAEGHEIVGFDAKTYAATGWNKVISLIPVHQRDVTDRVLVEMVVSGERPDLVYHLAAESHVCNSLADPSLAFRVNAEGTQNVALACARHNVPLVYVSTDEVYGDAYGLSPRVEMDPLRPSSPYSAGKAAGEMAVHAACRSFGLRAAIVRPSNAFGPGQYPEKLIPIACRLLQRGERVPLHGGGQQIRQWVHVEELADGIRRVGDRLLHLHRAAERVHAEPELEVFNLGGPCSASVVTLVKELATMSGKLHLCNWCDGSAPERPGQDMRYSCDSSKAREYLGWMPTRWVLRNEELLALLAAYPADGAVKVATYGEKALPFGA